MNLPPLHTDILHRTLYATDASAYREIPEAVSYPASTGDLKALIRYAHAKKTALIPRTAGTSLAGQVVGKGIVVDLSRHFTRILELNTAERWVRVQPGVILDELNKFLAPHGLFFGPETSTSNRCMMGGMVGNNSCGAHSILYGSTRDHLLAVKVLLSDGSEVELKALTTEEFRMKCEGTALENRIYRHLRELLSDATNRKEIRSQFPDPALHRRNTGYAIDLLLETDPFTGNGIPFNLCKLLAGSEGTLAITTEIKLNLVPLPPAEKGVVAIHFNRLEQVFAANLIALKYQPGAVELMDHTILELTKGNLAQQKNRAFIQGDPAALLIVEFARHSREEIRRLADAMEQEMRAAGFGYHFPLIFGSEINKIWNLRKSGLGVLSNMVGDAKPVSLIEDTAVPVKSMEAYITDFRQLIQKYQLDCVYHAHIGSGELHLRPVLNLKNKAHVELFRTIGREVALLVKKYRGSLSGEHGDGRLRGEFIPLMIGDHNYRLLEAIKQCWDPQGIFNPGKITATPPMNSQLRYTPGEAVREITSYFDFSADQGIVRATEKCNGSGDCRKTEITGGLMCPSYMATRDEKDTTRARANILREYLTRSTKKNPFDHEEIRRVMELCLSCKGCRAECPSNVDITRLKAEFQQQYYDARGVPLRTWLVGSIARLYRLGSLLPGLSNAILSLKISKQLAGFSTERILPLLAPQTLDRWYRKHYLQLVAEQPVRPRQTVYLFNDEFTNHTDVQTGIAAITLLVRLGYHVLLPRHKESGRSWLSKGLLKQARRIAELNVEMLHGSVNEQTPLIGIEPSALLSFRDEYPALVRKPFHDKAAQLARHSLLIDEFIVREYQAGRISSSQFTSEPRNIRLHGHCHQKALAGTASTLAMLTIPVNYTASEIPSGCCGMAGSFGYEKKHHPLSMKIGELILFPEVRNTPGSTLLAAPGTSCRHQILDGTGRKPVHPVEILAAAVR
ncbi:MAG: FAD-binding oxidoreductase [Paludibacter sp. 47-17]|nr:MAG: FAD-binding protein [Paludibacter sp. SCN 50-10]OJX91559.1 MAG: FAD-binding oxidoreductase [Paludibacter sp. 47-17]